MGFATTGFTPPLVVTAAGDRHDGPRIYVGRDAVPSASASVAAAHLAALQPGEGGVFEIGGDLVVLGQDDPGLLAAAEGFASRAPYIWRPSGERITAIARACETGGGVTGFTYLKGKAGINRAFLNCTGDLPQAACRLR